MKRFFRATLRSSIILSAFALQLSAQATRTWVSGVGDDVNPCSRTAPCKTFAGAISKTAAGGEIDALDPGGFGTLTITKAITIDGGGGIVASVLASGTNGIVIAAGGGDAVVLRNLMISGAGTLAGTDTRGIKFQSGLSLVVEHCDVSRTAKRGISIESSTPNAIATIIDSTIHDNLNNGIVINPPAGITNQLVLDRVRSVNNSAYGLGTNPGSAVQVRDSVISNNIAGGLLATSSTVDVNNTFLTGNGTGITATSAATIRIAGSTVTGNANPLSISSAVVFSYGDNYFAGAASGLSPISKQ
jgi:Right handed beta helix region